MTQDTQAQINLGEEAVRLLENPAFHAIFDRMESEIAQEWMNSCGLRDTEGQKLLLQRAKVAKRVREIVLGMVEQGKLASHNKRYDDLRAESSTRSALRSIIGR